MLDEFLLTWPKPYIRSSELSQILGGSPARQYGIINRAIKKGQLLKMKRGFYLIAAPYRRSAVEDFEIAQQLYGPSYVSLQSALSYHGWIPEAVYSVTSVSPKRSSEFETTIGNFSYSKTPTTRFFNSVNRIKNKQSIFLIADPWKALADYIYIYKPNWSSITDLRDDLRVESDSLSANPSLHDLSQNYPSTRVKSTLLKLAKGLKNDDTNY